MVGEDLHNPCAHDTRLCILADAFGRASAVCLPEGAVPLCFGAALINAGVVHRLR